MVLPVPPAEMAPTIEPAGTDDGSVASLRRVRRSAAGFGRSTPRSGDHMTPYGGGKQHRDTINRVSQLQRSAFTLEFSSGDECSGQHHRQRRRHSRGVAALENRGAEMSCNVPLQPRDEGPIDRRSATDLRTTETGRCHQPTHHCHRGPRLGSSHSQRVDTSAAGEPFTHRRERQSFLDVVDDPCREEGDRSSPPYGSPPFQPVAALLALSRTLPAFSRSSITRMSWSERVQAPLWSSSSRFSSVRSASATSSSGRGATDSSTSRSGLTNSPGTGSCS
ncbi:hypothetical protein DFO66_103138 [Brevibacterium sanguinis]|uniref:Uncharacterized protein n=2 Tax=Brevibacterium TaxID=1696 RepID=A0A366IMY9_9MICO|nr:hypothetical protein DFO66_103138 [Brevibacterium sanguinis]RBP72846.1 hypothetical protein DFO65_103137 [Brevibacterium celere]